VGFVGDKAVLERYSPSTSVSPSKNSKDCSTVIIIQHLGLEKQAKQRSIYQDVSPHGKKLKKYSTKADVRKVD
jgi:hypothetical protein